MENRTRPVVFNGQPSYLDPFRSEKLREWEIQLKAEIGYDPAVMAGPATPTNSTSPDPDDCDSDD
jgi:hypothetical protein